MTAAGVTEAAAAGATTAAAVRRSQAERAPILEALSALLTYPRGDISGTILNLPEGAGVVGPGGGASPAELVRAFGEAVAGHSTGMLEELYTRTFDLDPAASLETGWQLYGEAYERGAFLVKMRGLLRAYDVPEGGELPDHLASILRAMARMPEDEAAVLAAGYVRKAVSKMIEAFKDPGNPYLGLLKAASIVTGEISAPKESAQP